MNEDLTLELETEETVTPEVPTESMDDYSRELEASFKTVEEGDILEGTVIGVSETEVTVDLGYYAEGIIRLEDYTDDPAFSIKTDVEIGSPISATVMRKDDGHGNILLSKKEATQVLAWDKFKQLKDDGTVLTVKVGGIVNAGVIAYVDGIRGFIPASKLSLEYVEDLEQWLGRELQVQVITADKEDRRLVLSARDLLRAKADEERKARISNVEVGLVTEGTVETIMPYGAFVNLGNGLSGLVHVSQICQKRIKTPAAVLKTGDQVKVKIIAVKDGKISLSMKALEDVTAAEIEEEVIDLPESETLSTNLGDLFKNLKLD